MGKVIGGRRGRLVRLLSGGMFPPKTDRVVGGGISWRSSVLSALSVERIVCVCCHCHSSLMDMSFYQQRGRQENCCGGTLQPYRRRKLDYETRSPEAPFLEFNFQKVRQTADRREC